MISGMLKTEICSDPEFISEERSLPKKKFLNASSSRCREGLEHQLALQFIFNCCYQCQTLKFKTIFHIKESEALVGIHSGDAASKKSGKLRS